MTAVFTSIYSPKNLDSFKADIKRIAGRPTELFMIGDFNARHNCWNCLTNNKSGNTLLKMSLHEDFLIHYPQEPTFRRINHKPPVIDFTISNSHRKLTVETVHDLKSTYQSSYRYWSGTQNAPMIKFPDYKNTDGAKIQAEINNNINLYNNVVTTTEDNVCLAEFNNILNRAKTAAIPFRQNAPNQLILPAITTKNIKHWNCTRRHWYRTRTPALFKHLRIPNKRIKVAVLAEKNYMTNYLKNNYLVRTNYGTSLNQ